MVAFAPEPTSRRPREDRSRPPGDQSRGPWVRIRRIALVAALLCLLRAGVSFLAVVNQPSNSSVPVLAVEWLRDNGGRGFVNAIESGYYSLTAPAKGGPPLLALPRQPDAVPLRADASASPTSTPRRHSPRLPGALLAGHARRYYRPASVPPVITPALPGEGIWRATFGSATGHPPVLVTSFRSDPAYPRLVAGVAWIDHRQTRTFLYPGRREPSVSLSRGPMEVPVRSRRRLVATFNSGFKLKDSGGGFALRGQTYAPLKNGIATIVRYRSGRVDVKGWTGGPDAGPKVVLARQNLPLIVNHGLPNPNLGDGPQWGATLGNAVRVWRSGVGVDRHQNLIYAAANSQTVDSLAAILIRAGAVRAMELDINSYWTSFITYGQPGAGTPANLLAGMNRRATRYLTPDDRDFFAVYRRR